MFNHWKISGIMTYGSGRPANATVSGDPNQDGNASNDRLSKYGRNAFLGPDYATLDLRVGRKLNLGGRYHLELTGESFNLFNRDNQRYGVADNGYYTAAGKIVKNSQSPDGTYYPAFYQQHTNLMKTTSSLSPRPSQFCMRVSFCVGA